jgi:hypothetical protein
VRIKFIGQSCLPKRNYPFQIGFSKNQIEFIIAQMSNVYKPQRQFFLVLMTTLMCFRGKANFRNLSRYSDCNEKTYSH